MAFLRGVVWLVLAIAMRAVLKQMPLIAITWIIIFWILFFMFLMWAVQDLMGSIRLPSVLGGGKLEIISFTPNTCPRNKDLDAGLCYDKCKPGYHGVGPVCWADSENVGSGKVAGLGPCPNGWEDWGLLCHEPIHCASGWAFFTEGCSGGNLVAKDLLCPGPMSKTAKDKVTGLCYESCPKHMPERIPGMPYLCYAGGDLSYGRGVGKVPSLIRLFGRFPLL